jgi:steroid delta-isomerase-like uncharacterized protein
MLRTAFPDLRFEVDEIIAEGDRVATHSYMTGTHEGPLFGIPPTGRTVKVPHMHLFRIVDGQTTDLWHVWDQFGLMQQLGAIPTPETV